MTKPVKNYLTSVKLQYIANCTVGRVVTSYILKISYFFEVIVYSKMIWKMINKKKGREWPILNDKNTI